MVFNSTNLKRRDIECFANGTWESLDDTCVYTHCINEPTPPPTQHNLKPTWTGTFVPVAIGETVSYTCNVGGENSFEDEHGENTLVVICGENNTYVNDSATDNWRTCVATVECVDPVNSGDLQHNWTGTIKNYTTSITYACTNDKFQIYDSSNVNQGDTLASQCLWNKTWDVDPNNYSCIRTFCDDPPSLASNQMYTLWDGYSRVPFNDKVKYRCINGGLFVNDSTSNEFELTCMPNGSYQPDSSGWPTCVQNAQCGTTGGPPQPPHESIFFRRNEVMPEDYVATSPAFTSGYDPYRALITFDGSGEQQFEALAPSSGTDYSWLQVDLIQETVVFGVRLEPTQDLSNCDIEDYYDKSNGCRYTGTQVRVGNTETTSLGAITHNTVCGSVPTELAFAGARETYVYCEDPIRGRYVTFQRRFPFRISKVKVLLSFEEPDPIPTAYSTSSFGIEGTLLEPVSLYHSENIQNTWVQINFRLRVNIVGVTFHTRNDNGRCATVGDGYCELQDSQIRVGDHPAFLDVSTGIPFPITPDNAICAELTGPEIPSIPSFRLDCPTTLTGQFLVVQRRGVYLVMKYLEVHYGSPKFATPHTAVFSKPSEYPIKSDCSELYNAGITRPGIYRIDPSGAENPSISSRVYCENGWTYILTRGQYGNDIYYFNRTFGDYEEGFGDPDKEFWLGLKNVFRLTNGKTFNLRLHMWSPDNVYRQVDYDHFELLDSTNYTLKVNGHSSDPRWFAPDSFGKHDGEKFSTFDVDNDGQSCGQRLKSGFWFRADNYCHKVNLMGANFNKVYTADTTEADKGILYEEFYGRRTSLAKAIMAIRPAGFVEAVEPALSPASDTAIQNGLINDYQTEYTYQCPEGQIMNCNGAQRQSITLTCQWDQNWDDESQLTGCACEWTHCTLAHAVPPIASGLIVHHPSNNTVLIGQNISIICQEGMRMQHDFNQTEVTAECEANNTFSGPVMIPTCIETVNCTGLPSIPFLGSAHLMYPGSKYGPCLENMAPPSCPNISSVTNEYRRYTASGTINYGFVLTPTSAPSTLALLISFSQTVKASILELPTGQANTASPATQGPKENEVYITFNGPLVAGDIKLQVKDRLPTDPNLCIHDIRCGYSIADIELPLNITAPDTEAFRYDSWIQYDCGLARAFDIGNGSTTLIQDFKCAWNETWSPTDQLMPCVWTHCISPPILNDSLNMNATLWNGSLVPVNDSVSYFCENGMKFIDDFDLVNVESLCADNDTFQDPEPNGWIGCTDTKFCPSPPPPPVDDGEATVTNLGSRYGSYCIFTSFPSCPFITNMVEVSKLANKVTFDLNVTEHQGLPFTSEKLGFQFTLSSVPVNMKVDSSPIFDIKSSTVKGIVVDIGLSGRGTKQLPIELEMDPKYSTICIEDIKCEKCPGACTDFEQALKEETFFDTSKPYKYETTIDYQCGPARAFADPITAGSTFLIDTITCQWNETWSPRDTLLPCVWTHCLKPPNPPEATELEVFQWDSNPIDFDIPANYTCKRGQKFESDFNKQIEEVMCRQNNTWDEPQPWPICVETKTCNNTLPAAPFEGHISEVNSGLMFGHVCAGTNESYPWEPIDGTCSAATLRRKDARSLMDTSGNSVHESTYDLMINSTGFSTLTLKMLIQFSREISASEISSSNGLVTFEATNSSTSMLMTAELASSSSEHLLEFTVRRSSTSTEPCLIKAYCDTCDSSDPDTCDPLVQSYTRDAFDLQTEFMYGTTLMYECGLGREFKISDNETSRTQNMTCNWNQTWEPTNVLDECVWVACINPPIPPPETFVRSEYINGTTVEFGENVAYVCEYGYFFEEDYYKTHFNVTCLSNGDWSYPAEWPLCLDPATRYCPNPPNPHDNGGISNWDTTLNAITPYDTVVEYGCDVARRLENSTGSPNDTYLYDVQKLRCKWDQRWSPSTDLDPCVWIACIDPPVYPELNLRVLWDGNPVNFFDNVTYECARNGLWFEHDREMKSFQVQCLPDGSWSVPDDWPRCVSTVFCDDPPARPRGGSWAWSKNATYGTEIKYDCGPYAKFEDADGNLYTSTSITCQWNKNWTNYVLDPCTWTHCNYIPEPSLSKNQLYFPEPGTNFVLQTDNAKYLPALPYHIPVPFTYGKVETFILEGFIGSYLSSNPTINFMNTDNNVVLGVILEVADSFLRVESWLDANVLTPEITSDLGEPFRVEVSYKPASFTFEIFFNQDDVLEFPLSISSDIAFKRVEVSGSVSASFAGFGPIGMSAAVPVGTEITYGCDDGYVYSEDWYAFPRTTIKCLSDGLFDTPTSWSQCVLPTTSTIPCPAEGCPTTTTAEPTSPPVPPTLSPELLLYKAHTDYHWPTFQLNGTKFIGGYDPETGKGNGPFGFKASSKLADGQCIIDDDWMREGDLCAQNPINCEEGISFSIWEKVEVPYDIMVGHGKKVHPRNYLFTTGGDFDATEGIAWPGFAVYRQGGDLVGMLSTGKNVWEIRVTGRIFNNTWANIGLKWVQPNLVDTIPDPMKRGGLEMLVDGETVGTSVFPEFNDVTSNMEFTPATDTETEIDGRSPPVMMIGCGWNYKEKTYDYFSPGEYDELAVWTRRLAQNATHDENKFFLGGFSKEFAGLTAEQANVQMENADLKDGAQAKVAQDILEAMVLEPPTTVAPRPTRTTLRGQTLKTEATTGPETTTLFGPADEEGCAKSQLATAKAFATVLKADEVPDGLSADQVSARLAVSIAANTLLSGNEGNVRKWGCVTGKYPGHRGAADSHGKLLDYMLAYTSAVNTSAEEKTRWFNPKTNEFKYSASGDDFVMNCEKIPMDTARQSPRRTFPNYQGAEWFKNKAKWDDPKDTFSVPTGMFKDQPNCADKPITFYYSLNNGYGAAAPHRCNRAYVHNAEWQVDAKVFTSGTRISPDPLDSVPEEVAACSPSQEFLNENPIRGEFYHKKKGKAKMVRRLLFHTDSGVDESGIEVRHCVWWNDDFGSGGAWDPNGCRLLYTDAEKTECECSHFGAMTVLVEMSERFEVDDCPEIMNILRYVGIAFSILSLLVLIVVCITSTYVWDMFHAVRMHACICWIVGVGLSIVTDLDSIKDDSHLNMLVGLCMVYFYIASLTWVVCELHATFKAFTSGIISSRTKVYFPFGYGTPFLLIGALMTIFGEDLGTDPRCWISWYNWPKSVFLYYVFVLLLCAIVLGLIILFNIAKPQTKRRNVVDDLTAQGRGLVAYTIFLLIHWLLGYYALVRNPESDQPDLYCEWIVYNGWLGLIMFFCLGLGSKRVLGALKGEKRRQKEKIAKYQATGAGATVATATSNGDEDDLEVLGDPEDGNSPTGSPNTSRPTSGTSVGSRPMSGVAADEDELPQDEEPVEEGTNEEEQDVVPEEDEPAPEDEATADDQEDQDIENENIV